MKLYQFVKKTRVFVLVAMGVSTQAALAQIPQGINYQAIARNAAGQEIPNATITLRLTITNGNGGSTLYTETDTATTNQFGLFTLQIGLKDTSNFSAINWGSTAPWLKVEMDPSGHASFVLMGSSQLLSVPYALYAAHGNQGAPGTNGTNGATWYTGAGAPSGGTGVVNDLYLNTTTGDYYKKTGASVWTIQGNLTGGQGVPGNNGTNGTTWYTGAGAPSGGTGAVNDLYLNTTTTDYYKKTGASSWTIQGNLTGVQGVPGNNGTNGATWYTGAGAPSGGTGVVNDLYLNTTTGDYYKKTGASTWTIQGNLTGIQGVPGNNGTPGTNGTNGATWYTATGAPSSGTGVVNDLYLDTSSGDYYKKTGASTWTLQGNLMGPAASYTAGSGISIVGNTISATGGGTLGQSSTSSYSTSQLTLDPTFAGTYYIIPGTSQTINVPANCTVNISSYGGIQNLGVSNGDFAAVDIALAVDASFLSNAGIQYVFVPNSTSVGQTIANWSLSQSGTLTAGSHTFAVYAAWDSDSGVEGSLNAVEAHVGSSLANSVLRSVLTVTIIKN